MPTPLRPKHERFCRSYLLNPNATAAARDAGYGHASAEKQGYRLLRRADVIARLAALRAEIAERDCLSVNALLAKLEAAFHKALRIVEMQARLGGIAARAELAETASSAAAEAGAATRAALIYMAKQVGLPVPQFEAPSASGA